MNTIVVHANVPVTATPKKAVASPEAVYYYYYYYHYSGGGSKHKKLMIK